MGAAASTEADLESVKTTILEKLKAVKETHPKNLTAKHLTEELINLLSPEDQRVLYQCTLSGLENPESQLGCYAMTPADYEKFNSFFDKLIREYHGDDAGDKTHTTDWSLALKAPEAEGGEGEEKKSARVEEKSLKLSELGLEDVSMRIRVGRNLTGFNLPGMMTKEERISFEVKMLKIFDIFIADENFKGKVHSLTPDFNVGEEKKENANLISDEDYKKLVDDHLMFKNMDNDAYLKTAGIASDWPFGRGCYISEKQDFIIWFGEEDQLRIMCMEKGTDLGALFKKLESCLTKITSVENVEFARSEKYGFVTSCPSNLGTGMRASVHIQVPKLLKVHGLDKVKEMCDEKKLSVRGVGGEHTDVGDDGTIDLSPKARLFVSEAEIVSSLYDGVKFLVEEEKKVSVEDAKEPEKKAEEVKA